MSPSSPIHTPCAEDCSSHWVARQDTSRANLAQPFIAILITFFILITFIAFFILIILITRRLLAPTKGLGCCWWRTTWDASQKKWQIGGELLTSGLICRRASDRDEGELKWSSDSRNLKEPFQPFILRSKVRILSVAASVLQRSQETSLSAWFFYCKSCNYLLWWLW